MVLTAEEVETFISRGFIVVRGALDPQLAADWVAHSCVHLPHTNVASPCPVSCGLSSLTSKPSSPSSPASSVLLALPVLPVLRLVLHLLRLLSGARLGCDPSDPASWGRDAEGGRFERLEPTRSSPMAVAAPRAFEAICQLVGGADRLDKVSLTDTMIMNLGGKKGAKYVSPAAVAKSGAGGWHKDGWHFKHFLDSPDQALLVTAMFSDVLPGAGGTFIAADSPPHVARWYAAHPQVGVRKPPSTSSESSRTGESSRAPCLTSIMALKLPPSDLRAPGGKPRRRVKLAFRSPRLSLRSMPRLASVSRRLDWCWKAGVFPAVCLPATAACALSAARGLQP